jgi:hypothetical protein
VAKAAIGVEVDLFNGILEAHALFSLKNKI